MADVLAIVIFPIFLGGLIWFGYWDWREGQAEDNKQHTHRPWFSRAAWGGAYASFAAFLTFFALEHPLAVLVLVLSLLSVAWKAIFDYYALKCADTEHPRLALYNSVGEWGCVVGFLVALALTIYCAAAVGRITSSLATG